MRLSILLLLVAACNNNSGSSCPSPFKACGSACTAVTVDPANCGTCGNACAAGQQCQNGSCMPSSCPSGSTMCGAACAQTTTDNANCGSCGTACPAGQRCSGGTCGNTCGGGFMDCGSYCADSANDSQNCGACGTICPTGQRCAGGTCTASCAPGRTACGSVCADLQNDAANCGACGAACPMGEACSSGSCNCGFTSISLGWLTSCGQRSDGPVVCLGALNSGCWDSQTSTGNGTSCNTSFPIGSLNGWQVPQLNGSVSIDSGREFMCALKSDGTVWCLGSNLDGRLGDGEQVPSPQPSPVQVLALPAASPSPLPLTGVKQLALGAAHACVLKTNGEIWCWGRGTSGELGNDSTASSSTAILALLPGGVSGVKKVVAGEKHSCLLNGDNTVWCWGANDLFQCGLNNNTTPQLSPQKVVSLDSVSDVVSRFDTTCAIRNDKTLWCWGQNQESQTGFPATTLQTVPSPTPVPLTDVAEVSVGISYTCARQSTGKVFCWGNNAHGEIGNGSRLSDPSSFSNGASDPSPAPVIDASHQPIVAKAISVSHGHSCAIVGASNHPFCWGNNKKGQAGLTAPFSTVAAPVVSCGY